MKLTTIILLTVLTACSNSATTAAEDAAQELTVEQMLIRDSIRADSMIQAIINVPEDSADIEYLD